jgi:diadenosine hexaphosphate hydrolase (ATP-forming)
VTQNLPPVSLILGAGGVVFGPEGKVLLVRYPSGAWAFPKGHVEPGETLAQTAVREVQEEGGVTASIVGPLTSTRYTNDRQQAREIHWFAMNTEQREPHLEDTFSEGGFFGPAVALEMLSYPEDRQLLNQALHLLISTD